MLGEKGDREREGARERRKELGEGEGETGWWISYERAGRNEEGGGRR
jgi:hypothetical protein